MNFSPELSEIISETKYLEKLDFPVPDLARNVALQEEKFLAYCNGLNRCLARYHSLLGSLKEAEVLCSYVQVHIRTCIYVHVHVSAHFIEEAIEHGCT